MLRVRGGALACAFLALVATPARAEPAPSLSEMERRTAARALQARGLRLDPAPAGKRIERIELVVHDVFDDEDPVPDFFNLLHVTTRERVVRRELLFAPGERWDDERVAESARNLRALPQLSLVLVLAAAGRKADGVVAVVVVRDVWSLRLNTYFEAVNGQLTTLVLQPSEINLLGTHAQAGLSYVLEPDTASLGATWTQPRIWGSRLSGALGGSVVLNRESGRAEGSFGTFHYGQPLFSRHAEWGFRTFYAWRRDVYRRYSGLRLLTFDAEATPDDDALPWVYDADRQYGQLEATRSLGLRVKHDVSLGVEAARQAFATGLPRGDAASDEFARRVLPRRDTRLSPYVQVEARTTDYVTTLDVNTLGLQEDYSVGHHALVRMYPAWRALGSTRTLLGTFAAASYTAALGNGFVRALAAHGYEVAPRSLSDAFLQGELHLVSPSFALGRLVSDVGYHHRYRNYLNEKLALGGEGRLRGYPQLEFLGDGVVATSVELRTRGVSILSAQLGGVVFYDAGSAFDDPRRLRVRQDAGFGVRLLVPQLDRGVLRADWGFPLADPEYPTGAGTLYVTFGQAFPTPRVGPPKLPSAFLAPGR